MKDFLRQCPLFSDLNDEELDLLVEAASENHYPRSSYVVREGDPGTSLFLIRAGEVKIVLEEAPEREVLLSTFGAGEFFGELSLFDGRPRSATVVAQEDSDVIEISRESFTKQVFKHPEMALKILAEIAMRFRSTDEVVRDYADKVYREAYSSLEKIMQNELNTAKIIYQKTEDRALKAIESVEDSEKSLKQHIESSWNTLTRTITIAMTFISIIGAILGVLGYKGISDINVKSKEVDKKLKEANESHKNILDLEESAKNSEVVRHTMLHIRRVKEALRLDESIADIDIPSLRKSIIYFKPSIEVLLGYIDNYKDYDPEIVIDAARMFMSIVIKSNYIMKKSESENIYKSHMWILENVSPRDWRTSLEVRENLVSMGKIEGIDKGTRVEEIVLSSGLNKIITDNIIRDFDSTKINAVRILVDIGTINYSVRDRVMELLNKYMEAETSFWGRHEAAIGLIKRGDAESRKKGYKYMLESMHRSGYEGFRASISIGGLDKRILREISIYENKNISDELVTRIKKSLNDKIMQERINGYLSEYANKIVEYIQDKDREVFIKEIM